jgi:hypothetical protein
LRQLVAYRLSQAIHVAAVLRIADRIAAGTRESEELARETDTHAPSLYRLLRALAAEGIFEELPDRRFALTAKGELLRSDAPGSLHAWAVFVGRPSFWQGWGELLYSVRTGKSGVARVVGMDVWKFREQNPEEGAHFDRAMTAHTRSLSPAVVAAVDWGRFPLIADIAGGHGAQLADLLVRYPSARGVLFDQPHVVQGAPAVLRAQGVEDRCQVVAGSFFDETPKADAYILKHILHDWYDADCVRILRTIDRSAPQNARVFVIERLIGPPNQGALAKSWDLNMLVGPGGMERSLEEFERLLAEVGWKVLAVHPAGSHHVLEAVRDRAAAAG